MCNLYRGPSKDASYQVLVHLAKQFQRRFFRNQPIREKNCLWWPCLLTDRDKMSNLYRGPSMDASYQVSVHSATRFQRKIFRNRPIRNKNCLWRPCLLMDQDKMCNHQRGPSIDVFNQVSLHLAEGFQKRLKCEKLTDNRQRTTDNGWHDGKSSRCLWQGELRRFTHEMWQTSFFSFFFFSFFVLNIFICSQ
jgi:hypothetical protein